MQNNLGETCIYLILVVFVSMFFGIGFVNNTGFRVEIIDDGRRIQVASQSNPKSNCCPNMK